MKKNLSLSYAGHLSDRVQDLYYGKVVPEGIDLHYLPLQPFEAFNRMLRGDFDCAEMSFSTYVIQKARGQMPFVAIPVFPSRTFRHSAIYVNTRAGIAAPKDLQGRRIGVPEYQMTAAVWTRGLLQHEYDVSPAACAWFTGGLTSAGPGRPTGCRRASGHPSIASAQCSNQPAWVAPAKPRSAANHCSTGTVPGSTGATCTGRVCQVMLWRSRISNSPDHSKTLQKCSRTRACG